MLIESGFSVVNGRIILYYFHIMPSSSLFTIPAVMKAVSEVKPRSIIDIGTGFGKYGFLIREYFDLRPGPIPGYDAWAIRMDGIEIFEDYITPVHHYIYNEMYLGEAVEVLKDLDRTYDLALVAGTLEHYKKSEGRGFLDRVKEKARNIIISTPYIYYEQAGSYGNRYEEHFAGWDAGDLKQAGCGYLWRTGISLIGVCSEQNLDLPGADEFPDEIPTAADTDNLLKLFTMYLRTGQYAECIKTAEKYLPSMRETNPECLLVLAKCYKETGDTEKAAGYAEKMLDIEQGNREAKKILRQCR